MEKKGEKIRDGKWRKIGKSEVGEKGVGVVKKEKMIGNSNEIC